MKRNSIVFSVFLLCSLILFGCMEDNPYLQRERDLRLDGWWLDIEHSNESDPDPIDSIFCHYDAKKGTVEDYRVGDKFGGSTEYWYTEKNTEGKKDPDGNLYDGILHILYDDKNIIRWEHYYRIISNDIIEISSERIGWEQKLPTSWQTLKRISKPEQFD